MKLCKEMVFCFIIKEAELMSTASLMVEKKKRMRGAISTYSVVYGEASKVDYWNL